MADTNEDLIPEEETYGLQEIMGNAVSFWIRYKGAEEDLKRLLWSFAYSARNSYDGSVYDREPFDPAQCAVFKDAIRVLENSDMDGVRLFMDKYKCKPYQIGEKEMLFEFEQLYQSMEDSLGECLWDDHLPWFAERYPQIEFEVGYDISGMEGNRNLVYKNGALVQEYQWRYSVYDGKWALNKITFSGAKNELEKLREDLDQDDTLLSLYRDGGEGFFWNYPEILTAEKTENSVIFYALETFWEEGEYLTHSLFTAKRLAEEYPALDFESRYYLKGDCEADGEPFVETARFHNGVCVFREKSKDKVARDSFLSSIPKAVLDNDTRYTVHNASPAPDWTVEKSAEEWLSAVEKWGGAIRFVPSSLKTPALCLAAVKSLIKRNLSPLDILEYIPREMRTEELCFAIFETFDDDEREELSEAWKKEAFCGITAESYNKKGVEYYKDCEHNKARDMFTKAIALKSDYASAYYNRAAIWYGAGERKDAIADYSKAIEFRGEGQLSNLAECYFRRGEMYEEMSRYQRAAGDFRKALEINPSHANAQKKLDKLMANNGAYIDAEDSGEKPSPKEYVSLNGTLWEQESEKVVYRNAFDETRCTYDEYFKKKDVYSWEHTEEYFIEGNIVTINDGFLTQYEISDDKLYLLPRDGENISELKNGKPTEGRAEPSATKFCFVCGRTLRAGAEFCPDCCASQPSSGE